MFRVVVVPEDLKKFRVGYHPRIIVNLQRLRMITQIMICWVWLLSSRISYPGSDNSWDTPEPGVWPPESAQGKSGCRGLG